MSTAPFAFDINKLNNFVNGDIGIADAIMKAQFAPIASSIKTPQDKAVFDKASTPNKKSGIHAMEKTVISSMLESQKPLIELAKICLELFGSVEYVVKVLIGGSNPLNDPNSMIASFKSNKKDMDKMKTGFEKTEQPPNNEIPPLPNVIYLGKYRRNQPTGDVNALNTEPENSEFWLTRYWPQYQNYDEFYNEEVTSLQQSIATLDQGMQQEITDNRLESIADEWSEMSEEFQLKGQVPDNISRYFKIITTTYLNNEIVIDIENDYDVKVTKKIEDNLQDIENPYYFEDFYLTATIKPEVANKTSTAQPKNFPGGNLVKAVRQFIKATVPIIIKKLIPFITAFTTLMSDPVKFLGDILMTKLKEHFEMFDPAIKGTPAGDKYWSGDKFVLDGVAAIGAGIFNITLGLKNGIPTFKVGKEKVEGPEQPILKQVANIVAMPINMLKGILDFFTGLITKLFKVQELPKTIEDFLSFKWIKDLLSLEKLLEFLGAKDGDITKIPFLSIPQGADASLVKGMIEAFLKMIIQFINGFITIPNTILNIELVPSIPLDKLKI